MSEKAWLLLNSQLQHLRTKCGTPEGLSVRETELLLHLASIQHKYANLFKKGLKPE